MTNKVNCNICNDEMSGYGQGIFMCESCLERHGFLSKLGDKK